MEVTKLDLINQLPKHQAELVALRVGHKEIKNLTQIEVKKECSKIISRAFIYSTPNGQPDEQILTVQTIELYNALMEKYSSLTIPEVHQAFKQGLDGLTGDFFGLCGKTYNQFLKAFYEKPERGKAFNAYLDLNELNPIALKPIHKIIDDSNKAILNRFQRYKATGDIESHAFAVYDLLCKHNGVDYETSKGTIKTLVPDPNIRAELFNKTKESHSAYIKSGIAKARFKLDKRLANDLETLLKNITKDRTFEHKLKEAYLKWYFDSIETLIIQELK